MIAPEVLDALLAAGATAEMIVAAVKADNEITLARKARQREGNAARQQRHREKNKERNGHNALQPVTNSDTPSPGSPPKVSPGSPSNNPPLSPNPDPPSPSGDDPQPDKPLTVDEIVEAWNARMAPQGFPAVRRLTETRRRQVQARLRENTLEDWQQAMTALERSAFLRGENDRGWRADFDFLLQPKSFTKLLEGAYDH